MVEYYMGFVEFGKRKSVDTLMIAELNACGIVILPHPCRLSPNGARGGINF